MRLPDGVKTTTSQTSTRAPTGTGIARVPVLCRVMEGAPLQSPANFAESTLRTPAPRHALPAGRPAILPASAAPPNPIRQAISETPSTGANSLVIVKHCMQRKYSSIQYVAGLDGVRAIAVILVMFFHFTASFAPALDRLGGFWAVVARASNVGWIGVDVFFVLSGYLITQVLSSNPIDISSYKRFVIRRGCRLLPAYIACLIIFLLVASIFSPDSKVLHKQYLLWTLTSNIEASFGDRGALGDSTYSLVHFWSLAVEWHFYLSIPVILRLVGSRATAAVLLVLLALACRLAFVNLGISDNAIYAFTICRIDSLAIGVLLAAWSSRISTESSKRVSLLGAFILATMLLILANSGWRFKTLLWVQIFGYSLISVSVAMILQWVLKAPMDSPVLKFLEKDWLSAIGRASYSLYIWHLVFFPAIMYLVHRTVEGIALQYVVSVASATVISAALGAMSYRWVEFLCLRRIAQSVASEGVAQVTHP
jgi:peptidoglycan/LPS O-acetylase OafA/YrhL